MPDVPQGMVSPPGFQSTLLIHNLVWSCQELLHDITILPGLVQEPSSRTAQTWHSASKEERAREASVDPCLCVCEHIWHVFERISFFWIHLGVSYFLCSFFKSSITFYFCFLFFFFFFFLKTVLLPSARVTMKNYHKDICFYFWVTSYRISCWWWGGFSHRHSRVSKWGEGLQQNTTFKSSWEI